MGVAVGYDMLDGVTREIMLVEFEAEQVCGNPYEGKGLTPAGRAAFPDLMRQAIKSGDPSSLAAALDRREYWYEKETYLRKGVPSERKVNAAQAASRLAIGEFNTWYVRGVAKRLLDEGVAECEVCRAMEPKWEPGDCAQHEGMIVSVQEVYDGHRVCYWPEPGNPSALSVPFGPGCHHVIKRVGS